MIIPCAIMMATALPTSRRDALLQVPKDLYLEFSCSNLSVLESSIEPPEPPHEDYSSYGRGLGRGAWRRHGRDGDGPQSAETRHLIVQCNSRESTPTHGPSQGEEGTQSNLMILNPMDSDILSFYTNSTLR